MIASLSSVRDMTDNDVQADPRPGPKAIVEIVGREE